MYHNFLMSSISPHKFHQFSQIDDHEIILLEKWQRTVKSFEGYLNYILFNNTHGIKYLFPKFYHTTNEQTNVILHSIEEYLNVIWSVQNCLF